MQDAIDTYFATDAYYEEDGKKVYCPTICGLALHLDLTRQGLIEYSEKSDFSDTVKKAKLKVELFLERRLQHNAAAGTIFNLKNNFSWKDKQEIDQNQKIEIIELQTDFGEPDQDTE